MEGSLRYFYEKPIEKEKPLQIPAVTVESFLSRLEEKISIVKDSRERTKLVAEEVGTVFLVVMKKKEIFS